MSDAVPRPRGRPRTVPVDPPEPPAPDDAVHEAPDPEELVAQALEGRTRLTPEVVQALNQTWRTTVQFDDDASKKLSRQIVGVLGRASHRELHPTCTRVEIDVPMLPHKVYVRINERVYFGTVEVWECEARTIQELVHRARLVEAARNTEKPSDVTLDLDSPLAERARAIQRA